MCISDILPVVNLYMKTLLVIWVVGGSVVFITYKLSTITAMKNYDNCVVEGQM